MSETVTTASEQGAEARVVLPPRHPRMPQLIQLEFAKAERREELKAILAECETAAEPIALEIQALEDEEAKLVAGRARGAERLAEIDRLAQQHLESVERIREERIAQDARLRAESDRLIAEAIELAAAGKESAAALGTLGASLADARGRFDTARTTGRGRHLERAIAKIEKQQETIVARNPGARYFRTEMAIAAESERLGLRAKLKSVGTAIGDPKFGAALGDRIRAFRSGNRAEPSPFEVKVMCLEILEGMEAPAEGVELRVVYRRQNAHVEIVGISDEARATCLASLMGDQGSAGPDSPSSEAASA